MHAAQCALAQVEREAALYIAGIKPAGCKFSLTIGTGEKSAVIRVLFQVDDECTFKLCARKDNGGESPLRDVPQWLLHSARHGDLLGRGRCSPVQGTVQLAGFQQALNAVDPKISVAP
jgi:hypothetical protein